MKIYTVKPRNKKEAATIRKVLTALEADFEIIDEKYIYNPAFVKSVLDTKSEKSYKIDTHNVWESIR